MKRFLLILLILGIISIFAQGKQNISLEELKKVLPGRWHGQLEVQWERNENPAILAVYSGHICIIKFVDLLIDGDLNFIGLASLRWSPERYSQIGPTEEGFIERIDINYKLAKVTTKIQGKINKDGVMKINFDPTIKIDEEVIFLGVAPPFISTKDVSTEELTIYETLVKMWMYPEINLFYCNIVENEGEIELSFSSNVYIPQPCGVLPSTIHSNFILKKTFCTKKEKIPMNMLLSTEYKNETKILPNGTKITKTNDKIKIVSEDGCVEIFITEYSKIIGSNGTEIEIVTRKILEGIISSHLYKGYIQVDIREDGKHHSVTTNNAIVDVTGTNFTLEADENGTTILIVLDGEVAFSDINMKKTVIVKENQKSICKTNGLPTEPETIDPKQIPKWWEENPAYSFVENEEINNEIPQEISAETENSHNKEDEKVKSKLPYKEIDNNIFVEIYAHYLYFLEKYHQNITEFADQMEKVYEQFGVSEERLMEYQEKLLDENPELFVEISMQINERKEELQKNE